MEPEAELLVILDPARAPDALRRLRSAVTITQVLEPRLALMSPRREAAALAREVNGVVRVADVSDVPSPATFRLNEQEAMFVEAWRRRAEPKERSGEGLPWDAPGFRPPDRPTS